MIRERDKRGDEQSGQRPAAGESLRFAVHSEFNAPGS
jgi:hypothetical protein